MMWYLLQSLLEDIQVEGSKEAQPPARSQGHRHDPLHGDARVIEEEFVDGVGDRLVVLPGGGKHSRLHYGPDLGGQSDMRWDLRNFGGKESVADQGILRTRHATPNVADLARAQVLSRDGIELQDAHLVHHKAPTRGGTLDGVPRPDRPAAHADQTDDPAEFAVPGIDEEGFEGGGLGAARGGRGDVFNDGRQEGRDAVPRPRRDGQEGKMTQNVQFELLLQLLQTAIYVGCWQIGLVQDGEDGMHAVLPGTPVMRDGLGLDAHTRIHQEQGALNGSQRASNFVRKVGVAGRVHQVEHKQIAASGCAMKHTRRLALDRDAPFALHGQCIQEGRAAGCVPAGDAPGQL